MTIKIVTGDELVVGGHDLNVRVCRCCVDEYSSEATSGRAAGELEPIHRSVTATDAPCPVHVTIPTHTFEVAIRPEHSAGRPTHTGSDPSDYLNTLAVADGRLALSKPNKTDI